jgi:hypothetical protein
VAARYDHVAHEFQYIYQGMRELFKDHPQAFQRLIFRHSQNYHDYDCHTVWGSRVRGFSTDSDDGAALLGQAFTRMILGEGSHITQDILEKKAMRAIDGALMKRGDGIETETGYLSIYTTPKGHEGCSAAEYEPATGTSRCSTGARSRSLRLSGFEKHRSWRTPRTTARFSTPVNAPCRPRRSRSNT